MIYYRYLYNHMDMLKPKEKLVYSALISHTVRRTEGLIEDRVLDSEYLNNYLELTANESGYSRLDLVMPSILGLAAELGISRNTIKAILKYFKDPEVRVIQDGRIVCHKWLFSLGYITLPNDLGISGKLLLFYGFIEDRSRPHNHILDTWASRLEELLGISKEKIYDMLYKLHKKGLVQRLSDGRLKVKPISGE